MNNRCQRECSLPRRLGSDVDVTFSKSTPDLSCPAYLYRIVVAVAVVSTDKNSLVKFVV